MDILEQVQQRAMKMMNALEYLSDKETLRDCSARRREGSQGSSSTCVNT